MIRILAALLFTFSARAAVLPEDFLVSARAIETEPIRQMAVHNNGRIKPFNSLARESILFLTGKYDFQGLSAVQLYLALLTDNESESMKVINIRDVDLREKLGFSREERYFSIADLKNSELENLARPLAEKQEKTPRLVLEHEKNILEVSHQFFLAQNILTGDHLHMSLDASFMNRTHGSAEGASEAGEYLKKYLQTLAGGKALEARAAAEGLVSFSKQQAWPEAIADQVNHIGAELFYNDYRPFLWAAFVFLILAVGMLLPQTKKYFKGKRVHLIFLAGLVALALGFGLRVYITGFAPVTNMYGTMMWVSLGSAIFGYLLFALYGNPLIFSVILACCSTILFLTESIPLVLSPDLDPIVAVLRSNLWLTIHVLTITISYAAFTITAIIGNFGMIVGLFKKDEALFKSLAHSCYRMIQLGVFLISVGIVLGGIWADYSWGRFWGWDPKETWALIADLGYIAILHARHLNWLGTYGTLLCSTLGYLLVVMAWYGVNFILATGLHSYGFSSGGQKIVFIYLALQAVVIALSLIKKYAGPKFRAAH